MFESSAFSSFTFAENVPDVFEKSCNVINSIALLPASKTPTLFPSTFSIVNVPEKGFVSLSKSPPPYKIHTIG